jgi:hypothetical protein
MCNGVYELNLVHYNSALTALSHYPDLGYDAAWVCPLTPRDVMVRWPELSHVRRPQQ